MKVTIDRELFARAAKIAAAVAPRRPAEPVHGAAVLDAGAHGLRITATDGETAISVVVAAVVETAGSVAAPAHRLAAVLADAPAAFVEVSGNSKALKVKAGVRSTTRVPVWASTEAVPAPSDVQATLTLAGPAAALRGYLDALGGLPVGGPKRWGLNGVALHVRDGVAIGVATDGHRAAKIGSGEAITVAGDAPQDALLPIEGLRVLSRGLALASGVATVEIGEAALRAVWDGGYAWAATLAGTPPDVASILPTSHTLSIRVAPSELAGAVTRAGRVAAAVTLTPTDPSPSDRNPLIYSAESLTVSADGADGAHTETIDADIEGAPEPITLSREYVIAALGCVGGDVAEIRSSGGLSPVTLTSGDTNPSMDGPEPLVIIMPIRR